MLRLLSRIVNIFLQKKCCAGLTQCASADALRVRLSLVGHSLFAIRSNYDVVSVLGPAGGSSPFRSAVRHPPFALRSDISVGLFVIRFSLFAANP
jgi:hypothetical protein